MEKQVSIFAIILLTAVSIFLGVKWNNSNSTNQGYLVELDSLSQGIAKSEVEKAIVVKENIELRDSLAAIKVKVEYIYIKIEKLPEEVATMTPNQSYDNLQEIFPPKENDAKEYDFTGEQVQDIHLDVLERSIYADLANQLNEEINVAEELIKSQNEALLISERLLADERLKEDVYKAELAILERQSKRRGNLAIAGGSIAVAELLILLIILL